VFDIYIKYSYLDSIQVQVLEYKVKLHVNMIISSNFLIISIYRSMAYIAYFVQKLH